MKILITGGAGFVGSNLAIMFKMENSSYEIFCLDNLKRKGSELNVPRLIKHGIKFIHGDVRNKEDLEAAGNCDVLIECSAEPSVLAGYNSSPDYLINTNLNGALNCFEYARKYNSSILFISTSRVYPIQKINNLNYTERDTRFEISDITDIKGVSSKGISEDFSLDGPRSLYGATKLAAEFILTEYINMYKIKGVINRCGVLTGPWQMGKTDQGVIVLWMAKHIYKNSLSYIGFGGKGKQVRDILAIEDLYRLLKVQLNDIETYNGKTFNIGGGNNLSLSLTELTGLCEKITKNKIKIDSVNETRDADIKYYVTDYSLINKLSGWAPLKSKEKILEDIYHWITDNKDLLKNILN